MLQDHSNTNLKENLKQKFEKANVFKRYAIFIDHLITIVSIWCAISIMITFSDNITYPNWPFYIDRLLILLFIFFLVYITLKLLRIFIFFGIILGIIYLLSIFIIDLYEDVRDPRKTENIQTYKLEDNDFTKSVVMFLNNHMNSNPHKDSLDTKIKSLNKEVDSLKMSINKLNQHIDSVRSNNDSIKKLPKTLNKKGKQVDSLSQKK